VESTTQSENARSATSPLVTVKVSFAVKLSVGAVALPVKLAVVDMNFVAFNLAFLPSTNARIPSTEPVQLVRMMVVPLILLKVPL